MSVPLGSWGAEKGKAKAPARHYDRSGGGGVRVSRLVGFGGTLAVSSQPRAHRRAGVSMGRDASPSPRPRFSVLVMHFLRPRIPFVLKFKKIRPPHRAGGGFLSGRSGAAEAWRKARGLSPRSTPHLPTPATPHKAPLPILPSRTCQLHLAETELRSVVSPQRRTGQTAGGLACLLRPSEEESD